MGLLIAWLNGGVSGKSGQIVNLIIAVVDPILHHAIEYAPVYFVTILNLSPRKTCNSQSLDSCNQNPTYSIMISKC